jgi:predicted permease
MLQQLLNIVVPVYGIVLIGYLYARRHAPDLSAANRLNLDVFTPALIFDALAARDFALGAHLDLALAGAWIVVGSGLVALLACRPLRVAPRTLVPPMMFLNSGNMGLPLAVLAFGEQALAAAVVLFLVENVLHFTVGIRLLDRHAHPARMLRTPLMLACLLGIGASLTGMRPPAAIGEGIHLLGQVAIPLMLVALGARLSEANLAHWRIGVIGALLRPAAGVLVVAPVLWLVAFDGDQPAQLVLFAVLPPAVLNYILAERYNQEPEVVAALVIWGNLLSLLVIPLTLAFLLPTT